MGKRSKSSARWLNEHFTDPFVQRAHAEGWRSRAVFKLEEVDRCEKLLKPDAICLDLAPRRVLSMSGIDVVDQPRSMYLAELALDMAAKVLKGGGDALIKVFQGAGSQELIRDARGGFAKVKLIKPTASRLAVLKCICWPRIFAWCSVLGAGTGSGADKLPDAGRRGRI